MPLKPIEQLECNTLTNYIVGPIEVEGQTYLMSLMVPTDGDVSNFDAAITRETYVEAGDAESGPQLDVELHQVREWAFDIRFAIEVTSAILRTSGDIDWNTHRELLVDAIKGGYAFHKYLVDNEEA